MFCNRKYGIFYMIFKLNVIRVTLYSDWVFCERHEVIATDINFPSRNQHISQHRWTNGSVTLPFAFLLSLASITRHKCITLQLTQRGS
jgi:hypothetical protein